MPTDPSGPLPNYLNPYGSGFGPPQTSSVGTAGSYNPFDNPANSLESSISASAAPSGAGPSGGPTNYFGVSASAVTPLGGAQMGAGIYSDGNGLIGGFFSLGPVAGTPGGALELMLGQSQSFSGESTSLSAGGSYSIFGISRGWSVNPAGEVTGEQWSAGLSFGTPVGGSIGYTSTSTSEFTSLYLSYVQFLNWVGYGYPGGSTSGESDD
jgi:hypothetical protein